MGFCPFFFGANKVMLNKRADKLELLRIAEAVALEKSIDKELIISSMESGIAKAAKSANMPQDNITRAVAKGTGDLDGISYEELSYEGYGPGGVAILINVLTDNKNRTGSEIRHLLTKGSGNMAEPNAVAWNFEKKGLILIPKNDEDEDRLMEIILESEAEDMQITEDFYEIHTTPDKFEFILNEIKQNKFMPESAEVSMIPKTTVKLEGKEAEQMLRLLESIEDNDDVQNVYANFDISDEEMEKVTL